ncbi:MAG: hypothetical protein H3C58_13570, partial [Fimbriimonadaceae bacterium]|nr:hypothetical protein [Fimbriimonadaceae bacterium]
MTDTHSIRMRRMLQELASMAEHASLTGALGGGEADAVRRYNSILAWAVREGVLPADVFTELPPSAGWSSIGVESRMLASCLDEGDEGGHHHRHKRDEDDLDDPGILVAMAPFMSPEDLAHLVEK